MELPIHPGVDNSATMKRFYKVSSNIYCMGHGELRQNRHTVSLLTDHIAFSPKYRGAILVEKTITLALDGVIRKTCKDIDRRIIDMTANVDQVHLFIKYSVSYIARRIKRRGSRELRKAFPPLKELCAKGLWAPSCYHGSVDRGEMRT